MTMSDPIADMLTRIRNAQSVRRRFVTMPYSRLKEAIAEVLVEEGFVSRVEKVEEGRFPALRVYLRYTEDKAPVIQGLKRISKPGCRIYTKKDEIPWVRYGLGTVILSTPRGVLSGRQARQLGVGGEVLCEVW
ncbi:MAG: 30S ribosomal protein S8 [Anaerolineales bacterium]